MNRFRTFTAAALAAGLLAGGAVHAQDAGAGGRGERGAIRGPGIALRALTLTEVQQQQVREIRERYREAARGVQQRVRQAMEAQRKAVEALPVNEGQIRATTFELAEAQTEAAIQQARVNGEIWFVLTPEQQEQVAALREARMAQRAQRRQNAR